jgi:hypothetical protein
VGRGVVALTRILLTARPWPFVVVLVPLMVFHRPLRDAWSSTAAYSVAKKPLGHSSVVVTWKWIISPIRGFLVETDNLVLVLASRIENVSGGSCEVPA